MKKIPLTKGQVALVSDHRFEELNQFNWYAEWSRKTKSYYAARSVWTPGKPKHVEYMARRIMNTPKGMVADHINRITLDNQDHNLRNVTRSQNNVNKRQRSSALGITGVYRHGSGYRAEIAINGVHRKKTFRTLEAAIGVRADWVKELHGEFACQGSGC